MIDGSRYYGVKAVSNVTAASFHCYDATAASVLSTILLVSKDSFPRNAY